MIGMLSSSHYFQPIAPGKALPPLSMSLQSHGQEPFRRIDRFVQLALMGSERCAQGGVLRPDCAVYLGSGLGPIGNNLTVQQQLIRDRELPKPFNFVNTLGSSAGFHVARNLGLHGQNLFISRRGASFEAVLSAALADLALNVTRQALVGVVEEVTLPLQDHRRRQRWPDTALPAEGGDWWLLQTGRDAGAPLVLHRFAEFLQLADRLQGIWTGEAHLICTRDMQGGPTARLRTRLPAGAVADTGGAFHDSLEAAQVAEFCSRKQRGDVFLADGDTERGWTLFQFRP
ncbi:MAG: hypothetical protein ACRETQ_04670 [Gammaproteobacteria bacterium]